MTVEKWDQRQLCPDGTCIGVIGPDGTCKMCGHAAPNWGDERKRGLVVTDDGDDDEHEADDGGDKPVPAPRQPRAAGAPAEWSSRQLCSDGSCIGVVGSDGTCKLCGRAADGVAGSFADAAEPHEDEDVDDEDDLDDDDPDDEKLADDDAAEDAEADDYEDDEEEEADEAEHEGEVRASGASDEPEERKLCPDGACVGVIGDDNKCKICGKAEE